MYPLAIGLIDCEYEDNCIWFMAQLQKAIGSPHTLLFEQMLAKDC
jgi:hypothetical protein